MCIVFGVTQLTELAQQIIKSWKRVSLFLLLKQVQLRLRVFSIFFFRNLSIFLNRDLFCVSLFLSSAFIAFPACMIPLFLNQCVCYIWFFWCVFSWDGLTRFSNILRAKIEKARVQRFDKTKPKPFFFILTSKYLK